MFLPISHPRLIVYVVTYFIQFLNYDPFLKCSFYNHVSTAPSGAASLIPKVNWYAESCEQYTDDYNFLRRTILATKKPLSRLC